MGKTVIHVNGKEVTLPGNVNNLSIHGDQIIIDGKVWDGYEDIKTQPEITIIVEGNVEGDISSRGPVDVKGDVEGSVNTQGRVECKKVLGDIKTQGSVIVRGDAGGNVRSMGKIEVGGDVAGTIHTMGKVYYGGKKVLGKSN